MNKIKLFIVLLLVSMSANAVIIKNVTSQDVSVFSDDQGGFWEDLKSGETWKKDGVNKLTIFFSNAGLNGQEFKDLTDNTVITFNFDDSTVTQN